MAYVIDRFGETYTTAEVLPTLDGRQPQGAGRLRSSLIQLPGGLAHDWRGTDRAVFEATEVQLRGVWVAESIGAMEAKLSALKALVGARSYLWRSNGTDQHRRLARLLEVDSDLEPGVASDALISIRFELYPGPWKGAEREVDINLTDSPTTVACTNHGNARIDDALIRVTAAGSAISAVRVRVAGVSDIQWTGTLGVGETLTIDCGARSMRIGGADAYDLEYLSDHSVPQWLRIEPGENNVQIYRTGGSEDSRVQVTFRDGWA